jgi:hypothetical protein
MPLLATNNLFTLILIILIMLVVLAAEPARAVTYEVTDAAELAEALSLAGADDVIELAPGTYTYPAGHRIKVGLTLRGQTGDYSDVVLDLAGLDHGLIDRENFFGYQPLQLEGMTFSGYQAAEVLLVHDRELHVDGCLFQGNGPWTLIVGNARLDLKDCVFRDNEGLDLITGSGPTTIMHCAFLDNTVSQSVIGMEYGSLDMSYTHLEGNMGQLLRAAPIAVTLNSCLITGNLAGESGLHMQFGGTLEMTACTMRDNYYSWGALQIGAFCQAVITQCDIIENGPHEGRLVSDSTTEFHCCDLLLNEWYIQGDFDVFDEDCGVGASPRTLAGVKALYR